MAKKIIKDRVLNHLDRIMIELDITGQKLALLTGLSPSEISDIKNGKLSPTQDTMLLICDALKIEMENIFETHYKNVKIV